MSTEDRIRKDVEDAVDKGLARDIRATRNDASPTPPSQSQKGSSETRDRRARETLFEVTPEQQQWFSLAGFSRMEWQRLIYTRWRYQNGDLSEYPQAA